MRLSPLEPVLGEPLADWDIIELIAAPSKADGHDDHAANLRNREYHNQYQSRPPETPASMERTAGRVGLCAMRGQNPADQKTANKRIEQTSEANEYLVHSQAPSSIHAIGRPSEHVHHTIGVSEFPERENIEHVPAQCEIECQKGRASQKKKSTAI